MGAPGGAAAVTLRLQGRGRARPGGALPGRAAGGHRHRPHGEAGPEERRVVLGVLGEGLEGLGSLPRGWAEAAAGVRSEAAVSRLGWCWAPADVSPGVPPVLLLLLEGLDGGEELGQRLLTCSADLQEQFITTKKSV